MSRPTDIPLEPPTAAGPGIVPAVEDRSYLAFIGCALVSALAGGFLLAVWMPLSATGDALGAGRTPWLIQSHGWLQLQGWAGLFVAGMAVRLIPRFAGRKPLPRTLNLALLAPLAGAVLLRGLTQPWAEGDAAGRWALATAGVSAIGFAGVAAALAYTLARGRRPSDPWRYFAWAGAVWWAAWAMLFLLRLPETSGPTAGLIGPAENDLLTWAVLLGPIGNFIWGVQSRSVPIFFGRKTPTWRQAALPGAALNAGAALVALATFLDGESARAVARIGLAAAGLALLVLPWLTGSVWGEAKRLRPRAKPAARFVLAANISALVAGALLVWSVGAGWAGNDTAEFLARDAARHAYGIGLVTMLILGMARLIAPVFALERTESGVPQLLERAPFWLLAAATSLRVLSALFGEQTGYTQRMHTASLSGVLGWLAIAIFAFSVLRAARAEPKTKAALEQVASNARRRAGG